MQPLIHGIALAFGLILPLGVQNVFIFNQGAIHKRFWNSLPAAITASICDTVLILLAVTGVSIFILKFEGLKFAMFLIGFLFLIYMGWLLWRATPEVNFQEDNPFSGKRQVLFAASVSLLNPHAILDTIGVIGTSSLVYSGTDRWIFTMACISVSWIWFFGLAMTGRKVRKIDKNGRFLQKINQFSALIIWGMALYLLTKI